MIVSTGIKLAFPMNSERSQALAVPQDSPRTRIKKGLIRIIEGSKVAFPRMWLWARVGRGAAIPTYTHFEERLVLFDEARFALKTGRFIEVGSHLGGSSVVLAEVLRRYAASRDSRLYCCDTWMNEGMQDGIQDTKLQFDQNTAAWSRFISAVRGDSKTVPFPFDGECDLAFIDGDHSYEGARSDATRFGSRVRVGGRLMFHDQDRIPITRVVGAFLETGRWKVTRCRMCLLSLERVD